MKQAYINGIILNGKRDMIPQKNKTIIVESGKIIAIGESIDVSNCEVIDLKNQYIMPGLINMHTHLPLTGKATKPNAKPVDYKKLFDVLSKSKFVLKYFYGQGLKNAQTELKSGVTTLRSLGGILDLDGKVRDDINAGKKEGPRILTSNMAISVPGGHFAGSLATEATSPKMAVEHVDQIYKTNPDWIKLMITGGVMDCEVVGEPGLLKMEPEMVKASCEKAHEYGLKVSAHVESPLGVKVALENGVDTIEHGAKPDKEIIELFKEKRVAFICTISPAIPYAIFDRSISHCTKEANINGKVVMEGTIDCAKTCIRENIPVGLGTDSSCPFTTHYDMWRELVYFQKYCGVTSTFALYSATLSNAQIAGIEKETGSIEVGKWADFIVTQKNPLEDLTRLRHLEMVVTKGKIVKNLKIKKMKNVEKELDAIL